MKMREGYLLVTALVLLAAVGIFVAVITNAVSNTSWLRVSKEKLFMASSDSMNGLQMGTSYMAHFANSIGGFDIDQSLFNVPFSSISWLQPNSSNGFFNSIYSSIDGDAWKKTLSILATNSNVLVLNNLSKVENMFASLEASGDLHTIPQVVVIQTKIPNTNENSKYKYFIVSRAVVGNKVAYSSGFVIANALNRYVYFTDIEPRDIWRGPVLIKRGIYFTTGDTIDGPLRSNDVINIEGDPVFNGFVQAEGYNIVSGTPVFKSGKEILSPEDIAKMNMSKIASSYSAEINSEIASPSKIKSEGVSSTPVGLDLSLSLAPMLENDLYKWLNNNNYSYNDLPQYVKSKYEKAYSALSLVRPESIKVTFTSNGNSKTMNVYYSNDVDGAVESALNAIDKLENDSYWNKWKRECKKICTLFICFLECKWKQMYEGPDFSDVTDILKNVQSNENGEEWNLLFTIKPDNSNSSVPGIVTLNPNGSDAAELMGLSSPSPFDFNFNGVLKTSSDLYISGEKNQQGNNDKTAYVSGKYTLYTTQNAYIQSNIVYNDADKLFAADKDWLSSEVSTSMVKELRDSTCDDFLNIVANKNITLIHDVPDNIKLMASLYAFTGSFSYEDYDVGNPKGQLFLYGSMMQHVRGGVGTFDPDTYKAVSGFDKMYTFDWRILNGLPSNMYGTPSAREKALLLFVRTGF